MYKKIFTAAWMMLLFVGCQWAVAATSISVSATPSNPTAPATVKLSISIADPDSGTITQVEYFNGTTSLGLTLSAPFELTLSNLPAGTYQIAAKATTTYPDNLVLHAAPIELAVAGTQGGALAYFIHTDQLNTPRAITDGSNSLVWRWDSDPFGNDTAEEQPAGQPAFTNSLRFDGQYFDRETNLHYNYYRDYDPQTGRYVQSDPIGLAGGINTYGYVGGNPLLYTDPTGENAVAAAMRSFQFGYRIGELINPTVQPIIARGLDAIFGDPLAAAQDKPPRVTDPDAAAEHKAYKDAYAQPPPPGQDRCTALEWSLAREEALLAARTAWDTKWGAHHPEAIAQSRNAIRNIKNKMKAAGCECP